MLCVCVAGCAFCSAQCVCCLCVYVVVARALFALLTPHPSPTQQLFEAVAPGLRLDAEGRATWEGVLFETTAGPCRAPSLREGLIK